MRIEVWGIMNQVNCSTIIVAIDRSRLTTSFRIKVLK